MFCPECRRHWQAPNDDGQTQPAARLFSGRRAVQSRCRECGSLLAADRLVAEFPAAGAPDERRLTIREILRDTAGPNPMSSFLSAGPLDRAGRRGSPPMDQGWPAEDDGWERSDAPVIPREFGRARRRGLALDILFGIGALGAMAIFLVSVTIHTLTGVTAPTPSPAPSAQVVPASALGAAAHSAPLLPTRVGKWQRGAVAVHRAAGSTLLSTTYRMGGRSVAVAEREYRSTADALAQWDAWAARLPERSRHDADKALVAAAAPGLVALPYSRCWRRNRAIIAAAGERTARTASFVKALQAR